MGTCPCGPCRVRDVTRRRCSSSGRRLLLLLVVQRGMVALFALVLLSATGCSLPFATKAPTATATATPSGTPCERAYALPNPVAAENTCLGSTGWQQDLPFGGPRDIEGFTVPSVISPDQVLRLYVSTNAKSYTFAIYRMGYYSGANGRLMDTSATIAGFRQPTPTIDPTTRMVSAANWKHPTLIDISPRWVSGIYLIKLVSSQGFMRYTFFVLRKQTSRAPLLMTLPLLTYQAYNLWGNYSLYRQRLPDGTYSFAQRSYAVSFDRPYEDYGGLAQLAIYDIPLINWLERSGYNVTYDADFDLGIAGTSLTQHKLIVVSGHSEYWSTGMRTAVTVARDAGTSLAFFGGNDMYWHVRLQDSALGSDRIVVCYKDAALDPLASSQPSEATVRWRDPPLNQPEAAVLGGMYGGEVSGAAPLVLSDGSQQLLNGTSLTVGSAVPGLVGGEYDRIYPGLEPAPLTVIAASPLTCVPTSLCPPSQADVADATLYTAPSGARVFDAATFIWSWGLSNLRLTQTSITIIGGESPRPAVPSTPPGGSSAETSMAALGAAPPAPNADFQKLTANLLAYLQT